MKKSISLAMALLMALSFASCSETPHTHEFSSAWEKDATHHWHAATCEHTEEKGSYAEHKDVNNDGVCDDCQYTDSAHVHTYASQWSANATHHWHATDCGHSLVDGKAEHTVDPFGNCDVCGAAIATSSMATELVKGKSISDALKLTNAAVVEALEGLPPVKVHCSVLAEEAIKAAISDYYKKQGIDVEIEMPDDCHECATCSTDN